MEISSEMHGQGTRVTDSQTRESIIASNILVHRAEAHTYDDVRLEIYNRYEQKRIVELLNRLDSLIENNAKRALDFGAGTGNITQKLLRQGYEVTALDISSEMLDVLRTKCAHHVAEGKLRTVTGFVEDLGVADGGFDLITCYSVLHHVPDYLATLRALAPHLKKGGVLYIDHELSQFHWSRGRFEDAMVKSRIRVETLLNTIHCRGIAKGMEVPPLSYELCDYWTKPEHHLDYEAIPRLLREMDFRDVIREDYHLQWSASFAPLYHVFRLCCKPDLCLWIARK